METGSMVRRKQGKVTNPRRVRVVLHLLAGGVVILISVFTDRILSQPPYWGILEFSAFVTGLAIVAIGSISAFPAAILRLSTNFCLSLLSMVVFIALGEVLFRFVKYDFSYEAEAWSRIPIYYRQPIVPTGDVYFRRNGSEHWTGQVLNFRAQQLGVIPNPYKDERVITVEYDYRGFRNPSHVSDWEIAIAGDSFTELGYLPHEQLFTSVLASRLNVPVLNLGTSYTGPLTQLSYLRDYGVAASTKQTMIVFFEGNDLEDLAKEYEAHARWSATKKRSSREFSKQPSLVRALLRRLRNLPRQLLDLNWGNSHWVTGYFNSSQGNVPVTLHYTPPSSSQLSKKRIQELNFFFAQYASFAKNTQVIPWLVFMPCKRRVIHDHIEFTDSAWEEMKTWRPTDLPAFISELADKHGIRFIDLTPALLEETKQRKHLLYNSIFDTHLNAEGSIVVGEELKRHLSGGSR